MEKIYMNYVCYSCSKEFILLSNEVDDTKRNNKYISCPHCGSRRIKIITNADIFKECMKHSAYKKINRAFRQVRDG